MRIAAKLAFAALAAALWAGPALATFDDDDGDCECERRRRVVVQPRPVVVVRPRPVVVVPAYDVVRTRRVVSRTVVVREPRWHRGGRRWGGGDHWGEPDFGPRPVPYDDAW